MADLTGERGTSRLPNFIEDIAAETDAFGAHARIAKAIAELISSSAKFKIIGLIGPWGSGKSTVARLIEKEVAATPSTRQTYFFCYDTWLHQSDPPRRAFLETLIYFLIRQGLTTKGEWATKLDELNRRVERSESVSTPTLTPAGRWIGSSLLFVPLGLPFIGYEWFSATYGNNWIERLFDIELPPFAKIVFPIAMVLTLMPLFTALGLYLSWRPKAHVLSKRFWTTHRAPYANDSILTIFSNKEVQKNSTMITRGVDPTAIEFQSTFRDILSRSSEKKPRFVFIIDNLDRLPEADAISMWSTIRSFFLGGDALDSHAAEVDLPVIILPIDERAVERMYAANQHDDGLACDLARSFMDKTFDLIFRVPPPVLSDWSGYFASQIKQVFGDNISEDDAFNVTAILRQYITSSKDLDVTPRFINTLINMIATLWMQWRDQISFGSIAYFAIHRAKIEGDLIGELTKPKAGIESLDESWQQSLAAIHYGVANLQDAFQIVMEAPLLAAIAQHNSDDFQRLSAVKGFDWALQTTLENALNTQGAQGDPQFPLHASALLDGLQNAPAPWLKGRRDQMRRLFVGAATWRILDGLDAALLRSFLATIPKSNTRAIANNLAEKLSAIEAAQLASPKAVSAFAGVGIELAKFCQDHHFTINHVTVPGPPNVFLQVLPLLGSDKATLQSFSTKATDAELQVELVNNLPQQAEALVRKIEALILRDTKLDWAAVTETLSQAIVDRPSDPAIAQMLEAIGSIRCNNEKAQTTIKARIDSGQFTVVFNAAAATAGATSALTRMLALMLVSGSATVTPPIGWPDLLKNSSFVGEVDKAIDRYVGPSSLHLLVKAAQTDASVVPVVRAIFAKRVKAKHLGDLFVEKIVTDVAIYTAYVADDEIDTFIALLSAYEGFWEVIGEVPLLQSALTVLASLMREEDDGATQAVEATKTKLDALDQPQWTQAITAGGPAFELMLAMGARRSLRPDLSGHLEAALEGLVASLPSLQQPEPVHRWFEAATRLSEDSSAVLYLNLRDTILKGGSEGRATAFFPQTSEDFLSRAEFAVRADDAIRYVVMPLLADTGGRVWLGAHAELVGKWIDKGQVDGPVRRALAERLSKSVDEGGASEFGSLKIAWRLSEVVSPPQGNSEEDERP